MDDALVLPTRHRLGVDAYERMIEAGIFGQEDRIELVDGELIDMAPIGDLHAGIVNALTLRLIQGCGERAVVAPQNPVWVDGRSLPQPDFAVLRYRADFYQSKRPTPTDILLLVEVSDSSLRYDRTVKLPLYARGGVGEVWIVDVQRLVIEAYREPAGDGYRTMTVHQPGERVALALAPEIVVPLDLVFE